MFFSTIRFLDPHVATPQQYLAVCFKDGHSEHIRGPARLYHNPVLHETVKVCEAIVLPSQSHTVVVFRQEPFDGTGKKQSRMSLAQVAGPAAFVPLPGEKVHQFAWSEVNEHGRLVRGKLNFQVISRILYRR